MANILYGVNGEGAGHSTRAKEVLTHLRKQGHTLHVASFDRGLRNLSDQFEVTEVFGFRIAYVNNRVRYKRTLANNLLTMREAAKSVHQLRHLMSTWKIDLVITDFEPLSCHVGHRMGLPVISIDNQHCLTNAAVSYPRQYRRDAAAAKLVTRLMTPRANAYLVISFFTAPVRKRNTFLFPPLLRQEILAATPTQGDHILVYVTSPAPALAKLLSSPGDPRHRLVGERARGGCAGRDRQQARRAAPDGDAARVGQRQGDADRGASARQAGRRQAGGYALAFPTPPGA